MYLPVQKTTQFSAILSIFSKCKKDNYDGVDKYYILCNLFHGAFFVWYICSALFRNLCFLQKVLRFLGIPRKRSADMNVCRYTRWMRSSPSPSPGRRCHFYRGPLGQPDTVQTRTVSDARHASDTALPHVADMRQTLSDTDEYRRSVSDACRASDTVRACTVSGCPACAACPMVRFLQKARHSIEWHAF